MITTLLLSSAAFAQGAIQSGAAQYEITGFGTSGFTSNYRPDGMQDNLFGNGWWIRDVGGSTVIFGAPTTQDYTAGDQATLTWTDVGGIVGLNAELLISIDSFARVSQDLALTNTTGADLAVDAFSYYDFDVDATASGDSATASGLDLIVSQTGSITIQPSGASAFSVTAFATLRNSLNTGLTTDFANTGVPFGPGDFTGGHQFPMSIGAGGTSGVSVDFFPTPPLLDCTGLDGDLCAAVIDLSESVNDQVGAAVIDEGAGARFRPTTIYGNLETLMNASVAGGCRTDTSFDGWTSGTYASNGNVDGFIDGSGLGGIWTSAGIIAHDTLFTFGDVFGAFRGNTKYATNRDATGFGAGHWIRTAGRNGLFVGLHATCDGATPAQSALQPWFGGPL